MKWNLVVPPLVFAESFLNGEYIPSRNVLDLQKQSGIFLILNLGMGWIFPSCEVRLLAQGPWCGWKTRPGLGIHWFQVETAVAVAPGILPPESLAGVLCLAPELLSDLLLAIS